MTTAQAFSAGSEFPTYQPGAIRLYITSSCPYAQRPRIVLAHKNIKYETVIIDLKSKPGWFLDDINPLGRVPALQLDDKIVYESLIVSDYLDEMYPGNKLTPSDPYQRARDKMLIEIFEAKVPSSYYKLLQSKGQDKKLVEALYLGLDKMEAELKHRDSKFYGGDNPMMVDFMLWPVMERVFFIQTMLPVATVSVDQYPKLKGWEAQMLEIPAIKCTLDTPDMLRKFALLDMGDAS